MPILSSPQALRLRNLLASSSDFTTMAPYDYSPSTNGLGDGIANTLKNKHAAHPDLAHLTLLVFQAVMEVVCVSLPGYVVARMGQFDTDSQKFLANLNTQLFTPCLIFTKLASQLSAEKLSELAVIPVIFVIQTLVSFLAALMVSRICGFKKRASNFVVAMAVFGNSNSLPISLVLSLSKTLKGLHWDRIPSDSDSEVGARGILYLLIFQQLGQLVRWTWGFNVLLAPATAYSDEDAGKDHAVENGIYSEEEARCLLDDSHSDYESGNVTSYAPSTDSSDVESFVEPEDPKAQASFATPTNGNTVLNGDSNANDSGKSLQQRQTVKGAQGWSKQAKSAVQHIGQWISARFARFGHHIFQALPPVLQQWLPKISAFCVKFARGLWDFMNPPLWAMLAAILVASIPSLQHLFFDSGTFINGSVTRAVNQSGQVAVPLILVVLGANLARNTLSTGDQTSTEDSKIEKKLLIASLVSRMLIPTLLMAPILAVMAKFVPISILDDPIFIVVCFLLSGAPSALQLAQICQINNVYMGAMSKILFQSYVVWILPSTLLLVMLALETLEWAK